MPRVEEISEIMRMLLDLYDLLTDLTDSLEEFDVRTAEKILWQIEDIVPVIGDRYLTSSIRIVREEFDKIVELSETDRERAESLAGQLSMYVDDVRRYLIDSAKSYLIALAEELF